MKIERGKNAIRNMVFGVIQKIYALAVPFVMRTLMIYFMGMQYVGLNSIFTSVLSVLNLAELGVGSAMVFSMYKPIAEDDKDTICSLMRLYKIYYRIIGAVILVVGLVLTPFIPHLISGSIPDSLNIYVLYLLNLAATVMTYWLFAYKNCLLSAHQRTDISLKVSMIVTTVTYGTQALIIVFLKDYYLYLIVSLISNILTNIVTAIIVNKIYPDYKACGKLPQKEVKTINRRVKDLFTAKLGTVVVNSVDTIVISAFLGLTTLAMYQNYYYIMTSIVAFIMIIFTSLTAGIGNSLITETIDKNYSDYKKLTFIICWIAGFCVCCLVCLYQPFMELWVGKENMFDDFVAVLFSVYFYLYVINHISALYKDAGGIWHSDRFRPLLSAAVNLALNLIFVNFFGIYAILLSTIISYLFPNMPWLIHNLFSLVFKRSPREYVMLLLKYTSVTAAVCALCFIICSVIPLKGVLCILIRGIICLLIPNGIYFLLYRKKPEFEYFRSFLKRMLKKVNIGGK